MKHFSAIDYFKRGFLFFTGSTLLLGAVFLSYIYDNSLLSTMTAGSWFYFVTAAFSQASLFVLVPYLLFSLLLFHKGSARLYPTLLVLFTTLIVAFFIFNRQVYSLYRFHINGFVLDMLFGGGGADIFNFNIRLFVVVATVALVLAAIVIIMWVLCGKVCAVLKKRTVTGIIVALVLVTASSHLYHAYAAVVKIPSVIRSAALIPYNMPLTANRLMLRLGVVSKETLSVNLSNGEGSGVNYPLNAIVAEPDSVKKNIVLIAIDSWNKRAYTPEVFPNITRFAEKCSTYDNHLSSGNGTTGSILGMFFSLPATFKDDLDISGTQPLLVTQLLALGYDVKPYGSATLVHPPFARMLFSQIPNLRLESDGNNCYERDCDITNDFFEYLDSEPQAPVFSFLFYDLAHCCDLPADKNKTFTPAWDYPNYLALNKDMDVTPYWNLYRNSLFQVDSLIGCVINKLEERKLLDNTVVIITGDHGEEYNENKKGIVGHGGNFSPVQVKVPFFFYDANKEVRKYSHRTTHYDVAPTPLKDYLGVKNPTDDLGIGHLMSDDANRDWHLVGDYINYAFVMDADMRILEKKHSGYVEIYDSLVNLLDDYKYDVSGLNKMILNMNRFYK